MTEYTRFTDVLDWARQAYDTILTGEMNDDLLISANATGIVPLDNTDEQCRECGLDTRHTGWVNRIGADPSERFPNSTWMCGRCADEADFEIDGERALGFVACMVDFVERYKAGAITSGEFVDFTVATLANEHLYDE